MNTNLLVWLISGGIMKKVFICIDREFPRKSASANYVEYLGKAIKDRETEVFVIGVTSSNNEKQVWKEHEQLRYCNLSYDTSNQFKTLKARTQTGKRMWNKIQQTGDFSPGDIIICYTENYFILETLWKRATKKGIKVVNCIAEWHTAQQYKYGYLDVFNYWYRCVGFYRGIGISGHVITISKKLDDYFQKRGCKTLLLPPMIDSHEFPYEGLKNSDKIRFIYSGNYKGKDSMQVMLQAMTQLEEEELENVEFHLTGIGKQHFIHLREQIGESWKKVEQKITLHEWLEYSQLVQLYNEMHFLLIARPDNRVTQSNFPSKIPEMMSYGIVPIMNKVGDCPNYYLKDSEDSILFENCTVEECKKAIQEAIKMDKNTRISMQKRAREKAEQVFDYTGWRKKIKLFLAE